VVDDPERRVLHEVRPDVSALQHKLHRGSDSHTIGRSHEATDVETTVASELQMSLLDSSSLVAKPRIDVKCGSSG